jgi:hypothetical protein
MRALSVTLALSIALSALCFDCRPTRAANPNFASNQAVIAHYGRAAREKWQKVCAEKNVAYPPRAMEWICLKHEKRLLLFARDHKKHWVRLADFPIIGTSGGPGPKIREGDGQIPEGFYRLTGFRPALVAGIGMDVDYPNQQDRVFNPAYDKRARGRLGKDILIHGSKWSTGCLAMGNDAIADLFVLAWDTGLPHIGLIFAPCDLTDDAMRARILATMPRTLVGHSELQRRYAAMQDAMTRMMR